jgi:hypothetical protein
VTVILRNESRNEIKPMGWGVGAVVGTISFNRTAHDQRSRGDRALKTFVQESRAESALSCARRRILEWRRDGNPQGADVDSTIGDEGVVKPFF